MASRPPLHRPPWDTPARRSARQAEAALAYDRSRASDPVRAFYVGYEWRQTSTAFLRLHPNCVQCGRPATQVDHIKTVRQHWHLRFDKSNLQSLCQHCHSSKTAGFAGHQGMIR